MHGDHSAFYVPNLGPEFRSQDGRTDLYTWSKTLRCARFLANLCLKTPAENPPQRISGGAKAGREKDYAARQGALICWRRAPVLGLASQAIRLGRTAARLTTLLDFRIPVQIILDLEITSHQQYGHPIWYKARPCTRLLASLCPNAPAPTNRGGATIARLSPASTSGPQPGDQLVRLQRFQINTVVDPLQGLLQSALAGRDLMG